MNASREAETHTETIDLKDPALAAFLAWLIPGLGHWYQGRISKACLFFVMIMGTWVFGMYIGSSRTVYASWRPDDKRLPYLCQIGVGLPALPALVQAVRVRNDRTPFFGGFMAPPTLDNQRRDGEPAVSDLHYRLHRYYELGTVYTMVAGLLNVLAIYDAWGGPVFGEGRRKEDEDEAAKGKDEAPSTNDQ